MDRQEQLLITSYVLGDGSLTPISRDGRNTVMLSMTHSRQQKPWLEAKAVKLNAILGRNCSVRDGKTFDQRTNKTYLNSSYSVTCKDFLPIYERVYQDRKKTFVSGLLEGLTAEHLANLWADDGNLAPVDNIGRLNLYEPESECNVVRDWIESITGAKGRYEDYEGSGVGRLRYPATEMVKIALAIRGHIHPLLAYKVDMRYSRGTKTAFALAASNPNGNLPSVGQIPAVEALNLKQWNELAKSLGLRISGNRTKGEIRQRIIAGLEFISGR